MRCAQSVTDLLALSRKCPDGVGRGATRFHFHAAVLLAVAGDLRPPVAL